MATDIIARAIASGKADLINGKIPAEQLPSYVDDVVECANYSKLPQPGEAGKIYVTLDNNKSYRWSGNTYVLVGDPDFKNLRSVTYADLKQLRDNSQLIEGMWYRITDYVTTTAEENTRSADHQFDIIVKALSADKLSEEAYAILHKGDTYFANSNLSAWKLWYSIDNDTSRFGWADSTNGKGVIYYMKDEFNNECPYDFKNILFTANEKYTNAYTFTYTNGSALYDASILANKNCYNNVIKEYHSSNKLKLNWNIFCSTSTDFNCYSNTFGYDCRFNTFGYSCLRNTFGNSCYSNTFGYSCRSNTFGDSCYSNTFGNSCYSNTFGDSCYSNAFGNGCFFNTFGYQCYSNTFDSSFYFNTFGNDCQSNTFGDTCSTNIFGDGCRNNAFGNGCNNNTFGGNCDDNTFGNTCSTNTFGADCSFNTFGDSCQRNTFGVYCHSNTFSNHCYSNAFDNNCNSITFGNNCNSNTFGNCCAYITFGDSSSTIDYCKNIIIDNDCSNIYLSSDDTSGSSSNYLQNVHIHLGVKGRTSLNRLSISVADRKLAYSIDYYANGSTSIVLS